MVELVRVKRMFDSITICLHKLVGRFDHAFPQVSLTVLICILVMVSIGIRRAYISAVRSISSTRNLFDALGKRSKLVRISELTGDNIDTGLVNVFDDASVAAFTLGWFKPQIFLSSTLIEKFAPDKLDIIILHEKGHQARRDPLWYFVLSLSSEIFWFVPIARIFPWQNKLKAEVRCDNLVRIKGYDSVEIARTLLEVADQSRLPLVASYSGVSSIEDLLECRVRVLAGERMRNLLRVSTGTVLTSSLILILTFMAGLGLWIKADNPGGMYTKMMGISNACEAGSMNDSEMKVLGLACPHCKLMHKKDSSSTCNH